MRRRVRCVSGRSLIAAAERIRRLPYVPPLRWVCAPTYPQPHPGMQGPASIRARAPSHPPLTQHPLGHARPAHSARTLLHPRLLPSKQQNAALAAPLGRRLPPSVLVAPTATPHAHLSVPVAKNVVVGAGDDPRVRGARVPRDDAIRVNRGKCPAKNELRRRKERRSR